MAIFERQTAKSAISTRFPVASVAPIWAGMPSAPNKPRNDFVVCREHIHDRGRKTGEPVQPVLYPTFSSGHAHADSIGPDVLAEDVIC